MKPEIPRSPRDSARAQALLVSHQHKGVTSPRPPGRRGHGQPRGAPDGESVPLSARAVSSARASLARPIARMDLRPWMPSHTAACVNSYWEPTCSQTAHCTSQTVFAAASVRVWRTFTLKSCAITPWPREVNYLKEMSTLRILGLVILNTLSHSFVVSCGQRDWTNKKTKQKKALGEWNLQQS